MPTQHITATCWLELRCCGQSILSLPVLHVTLAAYGHRHIGRLCTGSEKADGTGKGRAHNELLPAAIPSSPSSSSASLSSSDSSSSSSSSLSDSSSSSSSDSSSSTSSDSSSPSSSSTSSDSSSSSDEEEVGLPQDNAGSLTAEAAKQPSTHSPTSPADDEKEEVQATQEDAGDPTQHLLLQVSCDCLVQVCLGSLQMMLVMHNLLRSFSPTPYFIASSQQLLSFKYACTCSKCSQDLGSAG